MKKITLIIIFLLISIINAFSQETHDYAIIQGKNVIFRAKPSVTSKKIKNFMEGELVLDPVQSKKKTRIGKDEYYWYKIKTQDKKIGWVYGKYILIFDKNNELHQEYQKIMNNEFGEPTISKVKIEKDDRYDYILLRYLWDRYLEGSSHLIFFCKEGNDYKRVINDGLERDNYYINDKYIYLWSPKISVEIYDRNKFDKNMYYKRVGSLTVFGVYNAIEKYDSYIGFDPKTEISTIHWREFKREPMRIEKFRFNGTKFEKIE